LDYCIQHKAKKISKCPKKYENWWLILVDEISHSGFDENEEKYLLENVSRPFVWKKIIILSPRDGEKLLTIHQHPQ